MAYEYKTVPAPMVLKVKNEQDAHASVSYTHLEHLRLRDDARQAPASLDGLALVLDDTAHDLNDIIRELFPDREDA